MNLPDPGDHIICRRMRLHVAQEVQRNRSVVVATSVDSNAEKTFKVRHLEEVDDGVWQEVER